MHWMSAIERAYELAREAYAAYGIDTEEAMRKLNEIPVSLHCWQFDDVLGLENTGRGLSGGIQTTGNYPGKARNFDELTKDFEKALSYIPGKNKVNIHAFYLDNGGAFVDRDAIEPHHFDSWTDWANAHGLGVDFNPTFFSHEKAADGYTLASADSGIRDFWIEHGIRSRKIAEHIGKKTGQTCVNNIWIPDGEKEFPVDTMAPRERFAEALDKMCGTGYSGGAAVDALESKLFGIGSEAYVVGSHEFVMGYVLSRQNMLLCMDEGHFHPTEVVSAKLSPALLFAKKGVLLHVSRPVRWDSDHVTAYDDETRALMREIVRLGQFDRTYIATDYFDASINRVMAMTIGARNTKKALLEALLQPVGQLRGLERDGDRSARLAITEELRAMPLSAVWDYYCRSQNVSCGMEWIRDAKAYEKAVLNARM
jgi:L-rhamnose isomerase